MDLRLGGSDNLFHWLVLHLGPLFEFERRQGCFSHILLPEKIRELHLLSLAAFGLDEKQFLQIPVEEVKNIFRLDFCFYPGSDLTWLYRDMRERWKSCAKGSGFGPKIFISRRDASKRKVINENEVCRKLIESGFVIVCPGELPWPEQIAAFTHAEWIVGPHGAAFTNIIFSPPNATLVELFPAEEDQWFFRQMAESVGVRHSVFQAGPSRTVSRNISGFEVSPKALITHLRNLGFH